MAEFIIKCPHCNSDLQIREEYIGIELECTQCRNTFIISNDNMIADGEKEESNSNSEFNTSNNDVQSPENSNSTEHFLNFFVILIIIALCFGVPFFIYRAINLPRTIFWGALPFWGCCIYIFWLDSRKLLSCLAIAATIWWGWDAHSKTKQKTTYKAPKKVITAEKSASQKKSDSEANKNIKKVISTETSKSQKKSTSGAYASKIRSVMSEFSYQNTMSKNIYQQICNGTYRTVELLNILAEQFGGSTSSIMSDFRYNDTMSNNIYQQICNGTYRTVELLDVIARKMGCFTSSIMSEFRYQNTMSNNIYQQICNGTYRTVELLNLITKKKDE